MSGEIVERQDLAPDTVWDVVVRCRWEMVLPRPVFNNPTHKGYLFPLFEDCESNVSLASSVGGRLATPSLVPFFGALYWGMVEWELPYRLGEEVTRLEEEADSYPTLYLLIKGELARRFRSS